MTELTAINNQQQAEPGAPGRSSTSHGPVEGRSACCGTNTCAITTPDGQMASAGMYLVEGGIQSDKATRLNDLDLEAARHALRDARLQP